MIMPSGFYSLKPGDVIGVAAPSARFNEQEVHTGVQCLKDMGFKVRIPQDIFGQSRYLAGTDRQRADVLNALFADPEVKGVIAARGGFGAMRILPLLHWKEIAQCRTLFMGFSDATALICALVLHAGTCALHGPNLISLGKSSQDTLDRFSKVASGCFTELHLPREQVICAGKGKGRLLGGNLATLVHLIGTPFQPDFDNSILFLEDVGEPAYKIDRMLSQMKMAGLLDRIQGVVTGSFEACTESEYIPQIIEEIFSSFGIPICMGLEAGHGSVNISLPMGVEVSLDAGIPCLQWHVSA